ncbi:MAG: LacI family transcriptional regulator [Christensenellaceae bacterium]|nr:LacI family transcriptional regulator [Christensenellaceae bacterium]
MNKKLSMKEISKLSGVSIATVSRVINGTGRFSLDTKRKVEAVINEYNYVPNMAARSLRKASMPTIGVIVPDITNEFFSSMVLELQILLFELQYSTIICNTNELIELEKEHLNFLLAQNVSGIIVISGNPSNIINDANIPIAFIDRKPYGINMENRIIVESDNIKGGYLAGKELIELGCKKIAAIVDNRSYAAGMERYQGLMQAQIEMGIPIYDDLLIKITDVGFKAGYEGVENLLAQSKDFDAMFCGTDMLALGVISALHDNGINVPKKVKVVGFDDISIAKYSFKPITTIRQDRKKIAKTTVDLLIKSIKKEEIESMHKILDVELIPRRSTRGKKDKSK